jgi:MOSC domain-containing protein YiiM
LFVDAPFLRSVSVGRIRPAAWAGDLERTAIDKRPVEGPVRVHRLGVDGDEQADTASHGGVEQAVYAYAQEDLDWWVAQAGDPLKGGRFGQNLTTVGVDVTGALIGERWRVGSVLLEVSAPRIPCVVFKNWLEQPAWVRRFTEAGRPGAYLRVLEEGSLEAGDPVTVTRPDHHVTIQLAFRALTTHAELADRVAAAAPAGSKLRRKAERAAGRVSRT